MKVYIPENRKDEFDELDLDPLWREFKIRFDLLTPYQKWEITQVIKWKSFVNKVKRWLGIEQG